MRVLIAQLGARRHYAVPAAFETGGVLDVFCTEFFLGARAGRTLSRICSLVSHPAAQRLAGRTDAALPDAKVRSFPRFGLSYKRRARRARTATELTAVWLWGGTTFCRLIVREGFRNADTVYAFTSAALELFEAAKRHGLRCVLDHATAPKLLEDRLVEAEAERYPGWAARSEPDALAAHYTGRQRRECELADVIVCGSSFVRDLVERATGSADKTTVVPLGLRELPPAPALKRERREPLRVLFVGDDAIRKGVGELAAALGLLGPSQCYARVVGDINLSPRGRREAGRVLELVGPVPRAEMARQYEWADVLVLPSVSDTFGLVILEAMSFGVPVVASTNTGGPDVIREGQEGFIVPVMSPEAIAGHLARLDEDRNLVTAMSDLARSRAAEFSRDAYAARLIAAIGRGAAVGTPGLNCPVAEGVS